MILTVDVGNTQIKMAGFEGLEMIFFARMKTDHNKTEDEYAMMMEQMVQMKYSASVTFDGGIISCVVPKLTETLKKAAILAFGCDLKTVGAGLKTGLNIRIENPQAVGSDLVCSAVAALSAYPPPLMIVSLGSATTFTALDANGSFLGGSIMPGVDISLAALAEKTAQLPAIGLYSPEKAICGRTSDCINAGMIYGTASAIDGMIARYEQEIGSKLTVLATGGNAAAIVPYCTRNVIIEDHLVLRGLALIYARNKK